ncbi:hypothetical protein F5Y19DRAFT_468781 [Xylariaceae sp. FL1651]|nr:hypothetical protein F5Y19DRAFT_468781 [Xylariaceae sp. FL1651]
MDSDLAKSPAALISSFVEVTENRIMELFKQSVSDGNYPFAAAVLAMQDLKPVQVSVNKVKESPLLHGETNCIREFFALPKDWTRFLLIYYLFTYEDTCKLLGILGDTEILQKVFYVPAPQLFTAKSVAEFVLEIQGDRNGAKHV